MRDTHVFESIEVDKKELLLENQESNEKNLILGENTEK